MSHSPEPLWALYPQWANPFFLPSLADRRNTLSVMFAYPLLNRPQPWLWLVRLYAPRKIDNASRYAMVKENEHSWKSLILYKPGMEWGLPGSSDEFQYGVTDSTM